jgi:hypothetical protein
MIRCVIHFYKTILGVPFCLPQGSIHIVAAKNEARAVEAAKRRFARRRGVADWTFRADSFDVVRPLRNAHAKPGHRAQPVTNPAASRCGPGELGATKGEVELARQRRHP